MNQDTIDWLLLGDPSIIYQTSRDLLDVPKEKLMILQNEIAVKGWGKALLARQDANGTWGGGLYGPKWISTHYTLMTLMRLGLNPENLSAQQGCRLLLEKGFRPDGGINHAKGTINAETCISGMTLNLLCYFNIKDERIDLILKYLLSEQMKDGGWNCERSNGATHSSFHTTISVLEALLQYESRFSDLAADIQTARKRAHEFFLCHHLFKSDKSGEIINPAMVRLSFPPRWKYDILRGLDYFQDAGSPHDPRFCDAITLLRKKQKNGKWPLQQKYPGRIFFDMEPTGQPSRINTLRALRVLKWWESKPVTC